MICGRQCGTDCTDFRHRLLPPIEYTGIIGNIGELPGDFAREFPLGFAVICGRQCGTDCTDFRHRLLPPIEYTGIIGNIGELPGDFAREFPPFGHDT